MKFRSHQNGLLLSSSEEGGFLLTGHQTSGLEHKVWIDQKEGIVRKIPRGLGKCWQDMSAEAALTDLDILRQHGAPIIPTEVVSHPAVTIGCQRFQVEYLLGQLYVPSHALSVAEVLGSQRRQDELKDLMCLSDQIHQEEGRGVDLIGGKAWKLILPALSPLVTEMRAEIGNLLVADSAVYNTQGEEVIQKGEVSLCDTRLFPFDRPGISGLMLNKLLKDTHLLQSAVIWTLLQDCGQQADFDFQKSGVTRFAHWLMKKALPKIRRAAESAV